MKRLNFSKKRCLRSVSLTAVTVSNVIGGDIDFLLLAAKNPSYIPVIINFIIFFLMHKRAEHLTVLTDIFSPCGRRLGNIPDITIFLSRQKSAFVKTARTENGLFLLRFVEDDVGIPGVFQGGRNWISAKRTVFGVRVRFSYA